MPPTGPSPQAQTHHDGPGGDAEASVELSGMLQGQSGLMSVSLPGGITLDATGQDADQTVDLGRSGVRLAQLSAELELEESVSRSDEPAGDMPVGNTKRVFPSIFSPPENVMSLTEWMGPTKRVRLNDKMKQHVQETEQQFIPTRLARAILLAKLSQFKQAQAKKYIQLKEYLRHVDAEYRKDFVALFVAHRRRHKGEAVLMERMLRDELDKARGEINGEENEEEDAELINALKLVRKTKIIEDRAAEVAATNAGSGDQSQQQQQQQQQEEANLPQIIQHSNEYEAYHMMLEDINSYQLTHIDQINKDKDMDMANTVGALDHRFYMERLISQVVDAVGPYVEDLTNTSSVIGLWRKQSELDQKRIAFLEEQALAYALVAARQKLDQEKEEVNNTESILLKCALETRNKLIQKKEENKEKINNLLKKEEEDKLKLGNATEDEDNKTALKEKLTKKIEKYNEELKSNEEVLQTSAEQAKQLDIDMREVAKRIVILRRKAKAKNDKEDEDKDQDQEQEQEERPESAYNPEEEAELMKKLKEQKTKKKEMDNKHSSAEKKVENLKQKIENATQSLNNIDDELKEMKTLSEELIPNLNKIVSERKLLEEENVSLKNMIKELKNIDIAKAKSMVTLESKSIDEITMPDEQKKELEEEKKQNIDDSDKIEEPDDDENEEEEEEEEEDAIQEPDESNEIPPADEPDASSQENKNNSEEVSEEKVEIEKVEKSKKTNSTKKMRQQPVLAAEAGEESETKQSKNIPQKSDNSEEEKEKEGEVEVETQESPDDEKEKRYVEEMLEKYKVAPEKTEELIFTNKYLKDKLSVLANMGGKSRGPKSNTHEIVERLKNDIDQLEIEIAESNDLLQQKKEEILEEEHNLKESQLSRTTSESDTLKKLTALREEKAARVNDVVREEARIEKQQQEINELEEALKETQNKLDMEGGKIKAAQASNAELFTGLEDARANEETARKAYEDEKVKLAELTNKTKELRDSINEIEEKQNERKRNLKQIKETLSRLNGEIEQMEKEKEVVGKKLSDYAKAFQEIDKIAVRIQEMKQQSEKYREDTKELMEQKEQKNREMAIIDLTFRQETYLRKTFHNIIQDLKGKIRVYCRVRPFNKREIELGSYKCVNITDQFTIVVDDIKPGAAAALRAQKAQAAKSPAPPPAKAKGGRPGAGAAKLGNVTKGKDFKSNFDATKTFFFDRCFDWNTTQEEIFNDVSFLIRSAMDGYNVCLFAYGQTGSGKTFTMIGASDGTHQGIAPRAIYRLFDLIKTNPNKNITYTCEVYMLEIYRDNLRDLLFNGTKDKVDKHNSMLNIVEGTNKLVEIKECIIQKVESPEETFAVLENGFATRTTRKTGMNDESSRSHLVFAIIIKSRNAATGKELTGKLSIVDLAGSERISKTGATAELLKEAQAINKSLSALGDVISALAKGDSFVPYRNSVLTKLMRDSIGGNAKTLMFVNISPSDDNSQETINSLTYASRVRQITNSSAKEAEDKKTKRLSGVIDWLKRN